MNQLDTQFHQQQSRLKRGHGGKAKAVQGQSAVAPVFFFSAGTSSYYEIPAIYRKRVRQLSIDNAARLAAYVGRRQAHDKRSAA